MFLSVSVLPFVLCSVRILRPSLSPKRALLSPLPCPFFCFSSYHTSKSEMLSRCQICISSTSSTLRRSLSLNCIESVLKQPFYMQQSNATPRPSAPSSGRLPNSIIHAVIFNPNVVMRASHGETV